MKYVKPNFIPELEGLRGVAALAVAVTHSIAVYCLSGDCAFYATTFKKANLLSRISILVTLFPSASLAVILFFVLSGFVLSRSLGQINSPVQVVSFYIKRLFRIYPVHLVCLALFVTIRLMFKVHGANTSTFYQYVFDNYIGVKEIVKNILLLKNTLNGVTWTLTVELAASFLLPFICFFNNKSGLFYKLFALLIFLILGFYYQKFIIVKYLYCFYAGSIITDIASLLPSNRNKVYFISGILISGIVRFLSYNGFNLFYMDVANVLCSLLIIVPLIKQEKLIMESFFASNIIKSLGRFSYSFYLIHLSVIFLISKIGVIQTIAYKNGLIANITLTILVIPISYFASKLLYLLIEKPFIKQGKNISRSFFEKSIP